MLGQTGAGDPSELQRAQLHQDDSEKRKAKAKAATSGPSATKTVASG
jgi:hypothetical protein